MSKIGSFTGRIAGFDTTVEVQDDGIIASNYYLVNIIFDRNFDYGVFYSTVSGICGTFNIKKSDLIIKNSSVYFKYVAPKILFPSAHFLSGIALMIFDLTVKGIR